MENKGEPVRFFINDFAIRGVLRDMVIYFEDGSIPARDVRWVRESDYEAARDKRIIERAEEER